MDTETTAPDAAAPDAGQEVVTTPPDEGASQTDGQGTGDSEQSSQQAQEPKFEDQLVQFFEKKGWDTENGLPQLLKSYTELESKLGNWSEVERKAQEFDRYGDVSSLSEKARMWDEAQQSVEKLKQEIMMNNGSFDYAKAPTATLAELYKSGQLNLADLPAQRQFEVQKYAFDMAQSENAAYQAEANSLLEKHPILKDSYWNSVIADQIEKGMVEGGRELTPEEIVVKFEKRLQEAERAGEERIKKDIEKVKQGNLERTSSAAPTMSNTKAKSVRDAFNWAKEHGSN